MGTWAAGPFGNDMAADFVGGVLDHLMKPIDEFMEEPEIDETFDQAFASVVLMNGIMAQTPSRPWDPKTSSTRDPEPIVQALLACFDTQIDGMQPDEAYKNEHRAALVEACDQFVLALTR